MPTNGIIKSANQPQKVLLFGASLGGELYLSKYPKTPVIAFLDNDPNRWGTYLLGHPVLEPKEINSLDYDLIIITSLWFDSIQHQLVEELGVPKEKIHIPTKRELKPTSYPYQHPETLALAQQLLGQITEYCLSHQIETIVDSGTALGLIRDGDLIPWDDDIDFAIDDQQFDQLVKLIPALVSTLPQPQHTHWEATLIKLAEQGVCVNLDLVATEKASVKNLEISFQRRLTKNGRSELLSSAGIFDAPAHHFTNPKKIDFKGRTALLPNDVENFLSFMYGNWQTPEKNTSLASYDNRVKQQVFDPRSIQVSKETIQLGR